MSEKQVVEPEEKKTETTEDEMIIDTSKMSDGKRAALELAEESRDTVWRYPTFAGKLFMGTMPWDLVHPYPLQSSEDQAMSSSSSWRRSSTTRSIRTPSTARARFPTR